MRHCPYCAEEIQDAAIVCRYCGRDLRTPIRAQPEATSPARKHGLVDVRTGAACLGGWLLAEGVAIAVRMILFGMYIDDRITLESSAYAAVFVSFPVGYFIGGVVTGKAASAYRAKWAGLWMGLFGACLWLGHQFNPQGGISVEVWIVLASITVSAMIGGVLTGGSRQAASA